jgi:rod shape-determining protein MreC
MKRLLNFIYRFRGLFTFISLEILCFYLIVRNNRYQSASYFSSANYFAASISQTSNNVQEYFLLKTNNRLLAEENAQLKKEIEQRKSTPSFSNDFFAPPIVTDSTDTARSVTVYEFITAKVINNSTRWRNNTLTLDRGTNHGVQPGMGVVGDNGLVGKIKYATNIFSVATSLLHSGFTVSSRIKNKVEVCTTEWDGSDPKLVKVKYVPRYHQIEVGDTVMTSGYNAVFPSDYVIGIINSVELQDDANFYDITAEIINDFSTLSYVHVITNKGREEKDSLENIIQ